jgi:hypothetical protein
MKLTNNFLFFLVFLNPVNIKKYSEILKIKIYIQLWKLGTGIESRWGGREFQDLSRMAMGPIQLPVTTGTRYFLGVKRPGRGLEYSTLSNAEVKERVEL